MSDAEDIEKQPKYIHHHECGEDGDVHAIGVFEDGSVADMGHGRYVKDGQAMLPGETFYHVDRETGRVMSATRAPGSGPAKVSSPAYRDGWDRIFSNKKTVGQA